MQDRREEWLAAIDAAADLSELQRLDQELLSKKGVIAELLRAVPGLPKEERPAAGKAANLLKQELERALAARQEKLEQESLLRELDGGHFDPSQPGPAIQRGSLHPITIVQN